MIKKFYNEIKKKIIQTGSWSGGLYNKRKDGNVYPSTLSILTIFDDNKNISSYIGIFNDISSFKKQQQTLKQLAHFDALTQLPNRALLNERLENAILNSRVNSEGVAIALLDLDGFKQINDTYGHNFGDEVLRVVASRILKHVKNIDTVSRLGGDEFVIVLSQVANKKESEQVFNRVLSEILQPIQIDYTEVSVSASLGYTLYPQDNNVSDILIRHADQAMYIAKHNGKNSLCCFDISLEEEHNIITTNQRRIEHGFNNNEFLMHYQPKINMKLGQIIGAEALIRWNQNGKIIYPNDFLKYINTANLEIMMSEFVIKSVFKQTAIWEKAGKNLTISLNLSLTHFMDTSFITFIEEQINKYKINPKIIDFEILESKNIEDYPKTIDKMNYLKRLGFNFSIDDFGTGYSSLYYLKNLPIDVVKIDKSFIINMIQHVDDLSIVQSILSMSRSFNKQVLAEGVETIKHAELLLNLGCELGQGFGFGKPMNPNDFEDFIKKWKFPNYLKNKYHKQIDYEAELIKAEIAHVEWVSDFLNAIEKNQTIKPCSKDLCLLGHWLSMPENPFTGTSTFVLLVKLHNALHDKADEAYHNQDNEELFKETIEEIKVLHKMILNEFEDLKEVLKKVKV